MRADEHGYWAGDDVRPDALRVGYEDCGSGIFAGVIVLSVFDDTDDFQSDWVEELEALSHNAGGAKKAAGEGLIDEGDGGRSGLVVWGEVASGFEARPGNLEITRRDGIGNCIEGGVGGHKLRGVPRIDCPRPGAEEGSEIRRSGGGTPGMAAAVSSKRFW